MNRTFLAFLVVFAFCGIVSAENTNQNNQNQNQQNNNNNQNPFNALLNSLQNNGQNNQNSTEYQQRLKPDGDAFKQIQKEAQEGLDKADKKSEQQQQQSQKFLDSQQNYQADVNQNLLEKIEEKADKNTEWVKKWGGLSEAAKKTADETVASVLSGSVDKVNGITSLASGLAPKAIPLKQDGPPVTLGRVMNQYFGKSSKGWSKGNGDGIEKAQDSVKADDKVPFIRHPASKGSASAGSASSGSPSSDWSSSKHGSSSDIY